MALFQVTITTDRNWQIQLMVEAEDESDAKLKAEEEVEQYGIQQQELFAYRL